MYDLVFIHTGFYDNELAWPAELGSYSSACNPEIQQLRGTPPRQGQEGNSLGVSGAQFERPGGSKWGCMLVGYETEGRVPPGCNSGP